jgi:hypothetical protein
MKNLLLGLNNRREDSVTYLTGEPVTFAKTTINLTHLVMPQRNRAKKPLNKRDIHLTVQAIKRDATLSQRRTAKIYRVPQSTISDRLAGASSRRDCTPNSIKLTNTEELVIVQHILKLDKRGYPPGLLMWRIWPTLCSQSATNHLLARTRLARL